MSDTEGMKDDVEQAREDLARDVAMLLEQGRPKVVAARSLAGVRSWLEVALGRSPGVDGESRLRPERLGPVVVAVVVILLVGKRRRRL
jgi:hypothetical protein